MSGYAPIEFVKATAQEAKEEKAKPGSDSKLLAAEKDEVAAALAHGETYDPFWHCLGGSPRACASVSGDWVGLCQLLALLVRLDFGPPDRDHSV